MNKIEALEIPHSSSGFFKSTIIYQSHDGETSDISKAITDRFGNPVVLRYVAGSEPADVCTSVQPRMSLNPADPVSRSVALSACSSFADRASFPQIYMDKFRAVQYAQRSVDAFERSISALSSSSDNSTNLPKND